MTAIVDAIVLAAGSATRFGSDKRLHRIDGVSMLQRSISSVHHAARKIRVVLKSADAGQLPMLLGQFATDPRVIPLLLENPSLGMGSNLAAAVAQLSVETDVALVMLADMPYLKATTVTTLVAAAGADRIVVPVCAVHGDVRRGHPVLFGRAFFPALRELCGDNGARHILQQQAQHCLPVTVDDEGILRDVDLPGE
ncbi:MAG TPA: nucleotidyltransferase family protein [Pseudomonadales bacterium]|nr:nucleotidyltransferase family protein [Pseudomonadales bacterium]